ncbi:MAG: ABC transporter permease [Acidobacteria bacterium]|nr:ABC transporter permease [Acidobacteriota bacterium]
MKIKSLTFELFVAMRYLRARRKIAVISVITAISVLGIAAGVASLIVALAINNGFRQDLQGRLLGATAHVNLQKIDGAGIREWRPLLDQLSGASGVVASAPALYGTVLASNGNRSSQMILKGVNPQAEAQVGTLLSTVREGSIEPLEQPVKPDQQPPVVIGKLMADGLGASPGDSILVTSPQGHLTPFGMVPRYRYFRVAGVFDSGFYDFDSSWAFTSLEATQQLLGLTDVVSVLEFKIDDIYRAPEVAEIVRRMAGTGYAASHWMEQNRALFSALQLEKIVTVITIGLIVFIAALNILISLVMMVMEKYKDIAVLAAMGASRQQIRTIFMLQGVLIGIAGTTLGLAAGYVLSWLGEQHHLIRLDPNIYSISYVPFDARAVDGVWVAAVALLISFLATLYPAYNATAIAPAEALRYE